MNVEQKQQPISMTTLTKTRVPKSDACSVKFKTQRGCKLGTSRYLDFEYDALGGIGTGIG